MEGTLGSQGQLAPVPAVRGLKQCRIPVPWAEAGGGPGGYLVSPGLRCQAHSSGISPVLEGVCGWEVGRCGAGEGGAQA